MLELVTLRCGLGVDHVTGLQRAKTGPTWHSVGFAKSYALLIICCMAPLRLLLLLLLLHLLLLLLLLQCPAQVSKIFKSPKNLKCQSSKDAVCYTNGTAMVVSCTNAAGSLIVKLSVSRVAYCSRELMCPTVINHIQRIGPSISFCSTAIVCRQSWQWLVQH
jgi:hypothetical protein